MMLRCRRVGFLVVILCAIVGASPVQTEAKAGKSLIIGGIKPCSGLPPSMVKHLPRYAAGTVVVLKGRTSRIPDGGVSLPKHRVAEQTVKVNRRFRFAVFPGHYVLTARLLRSNVRPFVQVTVREGVMVHVDVPNMCL